MSSTGYILAAILIIWVGVFVYLLALDRKLSRLQREVERRER
jgi:CcmD family protein